MRFYLDPSVDAAVGQRLTQLGHHTQSTHPDDVDASSTPELCLWMSKSGLQWVTADRSNIDAIYDQGIAFHGTVVFIQSPEGDIADVFERYPTLKSGRLYTLTARKTKVRQLPTNSKPSRPTPKNAG